MENKIVKFIKASDDESEIFFVSCKEYDDCMAINSSIREKFNLEIPRQIEPNIIEILDMDFQGIIENSKYQKLRILNLHNNNLHCDTTTYQLDTPTKDHSIQ